jgi:hypothetical protein
MGKAVQKTVLVVGSGMTALKATQRISERGYSVDWIPANEYLGSDFQCPELKIFPRQEWIDLGLSLEINPVSDLFVLNRNNPPPSQICSHRNYLPIMQELNSDSDFLSYWAPYWADLDLQDNSLKENALQVPLAQQILSLFKNQQLGLITESPASIHQKIKDHLESTVNLRSPCGIKETTSHAIITSSGERLAGDAVIMTDPLFSVEPDRWCPTWIAYTHYFSVSMAAFQQAESVGSGFKNGLLYIPKHLKTDIRQAIILPSFSSPFHSEQKNVLAVTLFRRNQSVDQIKKEIEALFGISTKPQWLHSSMTTRYENQHHMSTAPHIKDIEGVIYAADFKKATSIPQMIRMGRLAADYVVDNILEFELKNKKSSARTSETQPKENSASKPHEKNMSKNIDAKQTEMEPQLAYGFGQTQFLSYTR